MLPGFPTPADFIAKFIMEPMLDWIMNTIIDFVVFILQLFITLSSGLINDPISNTIFGIITAISISISTLGIVISLWDYFNKMDNTNGGFTNLSITDTIIPMVNSILFATFFVASTVAIYNVAWGISIQILEITTAGDIDSIFDTPLWTANENATLQAILMIITCFILIFSVWDLFKEIFTKVPLLILVMITGAIKPFAIARGSQGEVLDYIKSIIGISLVLVIKLFFFTWGLILFAEPNTFILGTGLIIASKHVEKGLGQFGVSMSTNHGFRRQASSGFSKIAMAATKTMK